MRVLQLFRTCNLNATVMVDQEFHEQCKAAVGVHNSVKQCFQDFQATRAAPTFAIALAGVRTFMSMTIQTCIHSYHAALNQKNLRPSTLELLRTLIAKDEVDDKVRASSPAHGHLEI